MYTQPLRNNLARREFCLSIIAALQVLPIFVIYKMKWKKVVRLEYFFPKKSQCCEIDSIKQIKTVIRSVLKNPRKMTNFTLSRKDSCYRTQRKKRKKNHSFQSYTWQFEPVLHDVSIFLINEQGRQIYTSFKIINFSIIFLALYFFS